MHPWVAFTSLILLWTDAVVFQAHVSGVVGQPVTLPCTYSTAREITTMRWGRGACPVFQCSNELTWTDQNRVTFQKSKRYELNGIISKGNVSLTIENAAQSDNGMYCYRVECSGWFNDLKINILLEIKPAPPKVTSVPTSPRVFTSAPTTPAPMQKFKTVATLSSPIWTTGTQPITPQEANTTSSSLYSSCPADGNSTVTQPSDGGWQCNDTHMCLEQNPWMSASEALYIGISVTAMILLTILAAIVTKKYLCVKRKVLQISKPSSKEPQTGTSQNAATVCYQAHENVYFESDLYNVH